MMTEAGSGNEMATTFLVDGEEYGGGRFTSAWDQHLALGLTADAARVARWLPSRDLHPLRWLNGRAVLLLDAYGRTLKVGDLPHLRSGHVYLLAWVTYGRSAAPPVLPALGLMLPWLTGLLGRRDGLGVFMLGSIATNRVAAELGRVMLGEPSSVGEIRLERGSDIRRATATDQDGGVLRMQVRTGGWTQAVAGSRACTYSARGTDLLRQTLLNAMEASMRVGRSSAQLDLGRHEWAELARDLGMSTRAWGSTTWSGASETMVRLDRLGSADHGPTAPTACEPVQLPFIIRDESGHEEVVDQRLDRLPFPATGRFEQADS
jgi:hypothetical protein